MTTIKGTASYLGPNGIGPWKQYTFSDNTKKYFDKFNLLLKVMINTGGIEFVNNDARQKGS
ncbi:TPA: hypothetical protein QCR24_006070 [Bacillus cereus]|nr:hypothetical protein [Bacillus cereus]